MRNWKYWVTAVLALAALAGVATQIAQARPAPKATGGVYIIGAAVHFNAYQTWSVCTSSNGVVTGCEGKGSLHAFWDGRWDPAAAGNWLDLAVKYVNIVDTDAWFAGVVTTSNFGADGQWWVVKVHDGGEPGAGVDQVSGGPTSDEMTAKLDVALGAGFPPDQGPFVVVAGDVQVHNR